MYYQNDTNKITLIMCKIHQSAHGTLQRQEQKQQKSEVRTRLVTNITTKMRYGPTQHYRQTTAWQNVPHKQLRRPHRVFITGLKTLGWLDPLAENCRIHQKHNLRSMLNWVKEWAFKVSTKLTSTGCLYCTRVKKLKKIRYSASPDIKCWWFFSSIFFFHKKSATCTYNHRREQLPLKHQQWHTAVCNLH